jgi:hypothetical protein
MDAVSEIIRYTPAKIKNARDIFSNTLGYVGGII